MHIDDIRETRNDPPLAFRQLALFLHTHGVGTDENWEVTTLTLWGEQVEKAETLELYKAYEFKGYYRPEKGARLARDESFSPIELETKLDELLSIYSKSGEPADNLVNVLSLLGRSTFFAGYIGRVFNNDDTHIAEVSDSSSEYPVAVFLSSPLDENDVGKLLLVYGWASQPEGKEPRISSKNEWLID